MKHRKKLRLVSMKKADKKIAEYLERAKKLAYTYRPNTMDSIPYQREEEIIEIAKMIQIEESKK